MILKSLYLKNYRTYQGPETIEFATGNQNITIIKGNNEVGKTTIMNAITWCLYGHEFYKNQGNEPIYSKSTILGIGIYDGQYGYFISEKELKQYKDLFNNSSQKYTYDLKKNIVVLNSQDIKITNCNYDMMIACYLLDYVVKDDISFVGQKFWTFS